MLLVNHQVIHFDKVISETTIMSPETYLYVIASFSFDFRLLVFILTQRETK